MKKSASAYITRYFPDAAAGRPRQTMFSVVREMPRSVAAAAVLLLLCTGLSGQGNTVKPELKGEIEVPLPAIPQALVVDASGKPYFYLASKAGGLRVYDIQNETKPQLVYTLAISRFNNLEVMNACQRGNLLYLALGNFFGANPQRPGLAVLDVENPLNPVVKDVWEWNAPGKGAAFVALSGDYAYIAAMSQGVIILNISDPENIAFVSRYLPNPDFPLPNPPAAQVPNARGLAVKDSLVYLCYDAGGMRVINVADKIHPVEIGRYFNPTPFAPAGKQQAFNNIVLDGTTAYVAVDYCGLEVLDISNPTSIIQKSWWNPWQCQSGANLWFGSPGHTNQLDLDATGRLVFMASAQSELSVVDVSDPKKPFQAGGYGALNDQLGTWGMTLDGERIFLLYILAGIPFQSNWAGVKILRLAKTNAAKETPGITFNHLHPNPFRDKFHFGFELRQTGELRAELYDAQGKKAAVLAEGRFTAGAHQLTWEGRIPAGVYFFRLAASDGALVWKMIQMEK